MRFFSSFLFLFSQMQKTKQKTKKGPKREKSEKKVKKRKLRASSFSPSLCLSLFSSFILYQPRAFPLPLPPPPLPLDPVPAPLPPLALPEAPLPPPAVAVVATDAFPAFPSLAAAVSAPPPPPSAVVVAVVGARGAAPVACASTSHAASLSTRLTSESWSVENWRHCAVGFFCFVFVQRVEVEIFVLFFCLDRSLCRFLSIDSFYFSLSLDFLLLFLDAFPAQITTLTVTSSVTRTCSLPREWWYLITQRETRGFLALFFFFVINDDGIVVVVDDVDVSESVEATSRLALAEKTSQSSKRTIA